MDFGLLKPLLNRCWTLSEKSETEILMKFWDPFLFFMAVLLVMLSGVSGLKAIGRPVAVVEMLEGSFIQWRIKKSKTVNQLDRIQSGCILEGGQNAKLLLRFRDGSWLRLFPNSKLLLKSEKLPQSSHKHFQREWVLLQGALMANLEGSRQKLI